jgi:hypothetical protein
MIRVALRGVIRIFFLAMQGVLAAARAQLPLGTVENGHPDAQGSEIDTGDDTHKNPLGVGSR